MSEAINIEKMTGLDKTAILVYALGPTHAAPLLESIDDKMLVQLGQRMSELGKIEGETLKAVLEDYLTMHGSEDPMMRSSRRDVVKLFRQAIHQERADRVLSDVSAPRTLTIWEKLSRMKPEIIATYVEGEHPQTLALILGNLDTSVASRVIALLEEDMQMAVVLRMSKIESVPAELVQDIEETLERELAGMQGESGLSFDGMVSVVEILKSLDKTVSKPILERLQEKDADLFSQVDRLLLVFDDLEALSDRDIQTILKHVSSDDLVRSLKGASDTLADMFFRNMSQRAAEIMREDMEVMPPLKLSDVEDSQQSILKSVRKLDDDGSISLGAGDEMV
ncbi:MAG: flagellar motor switch protein FliG [Mariprofundaceae bacterium]